MLRVRPLTTGRRHMTDEERKECVALYDAGATLDSLADRYYRDRSVIDKLIGRSTTRRGQKFRKKKRVFKYYRRDDDKEQREDRSKVK